MKVMIRRNSSHTRNKPKPKSKSIRRRLLKIFRASPTIYSAEKLRVMLTPPYGAAYIGKWLKPTLWDLYDELEVAVYRDVYWSLACYGFDFTYLYNRIRHHLVQFGPCSVWEMRRHLSSYPSIFANPSRRISLYHLMERCVKNQQISVKMEAGSGAMTYYLTCDQFLAASAKMTISGNSDAFLQHMEHAAGMAQ